MTDPEVIACCAWCHAAPLLAPFRDGSFTYCSELCRDKSRDMTRDDGDYEPEPRHPVEEG